MRRRPRSTAAFRGRQRGREARVDAPLPPIGCGLGAVPRRASPLAGHPDVRRVVAQGDRGAAGARRHRRRGDDPREGRAKRSDDRRATRRRRREGRRRRRAPLRRLGVGAFVRPVQGHRAGVSQRRHAVVPRAVRRHAQPRARRPGRRMDVRGCAPPRAPQPRRSQKNGRRRFGRHRRRGTSEGPGQGGAHRDEGHLGGRGDHHLLRRGRADGPVRAPHGLHRRAQPDGLSGDLQEPQSRGGVVRQRVQGRER
mmetsp:Transcript_12480/g.52726  ORF Transcript_12480/g.52726 Transcript_12480/m.52726 type:complete len:253 (-) Transcript_12480:570-1328(-)